MKRFIILYILISSYLYSQKPMFPEPLSPRIANYTIDVKLDDEKKMLFATELLTWKNDSKDNIQELQFHMYLNGFKNEATTFMKESQGSHRRSNADIENGLGWINILKMNIKDGEELADKIQFIQPDDDNEFDQTVIRVLLNKPIKPQETVAIEIEFEAQLPKVFARTGYHQDFFLVGQWFPKIGVYEEAGERYAKEGQWNCHQFHYNGEFFADYGVYDVKITLPQKYVVGATGVELSEIENGDGTKTVNYYCEDVHDFVWTADPNYTVVEDQWKHVYIKYLVQPQRAYAAQRHIQAAKNTLEYFEEWYGIYPYPTLTIVDPRYGGGGAGGMEYPTFITAGMYWMLPEGIKYPEEVTVHELGHNYWYGLVGSNEFEEAWLDEGFTTYSEKHVMDKYYGQDGGSFVSLFGINIDDDEMRKNRYLRGNPRIESLFTNSWEFNAGGYGSTVYGKASLVLQTLHDYLGDDKMKMLMRTYFDRFKFKHPSTQDFINTVNEVSGENMDWYFDQVIYGTGVMDYKVYRIINEPIEVANQGYFDSDSGMNIFGAKELEEAKREAWKDSTYERIYNSKVIVTREGEVFFPVEVLIKFSNGEEFLEKWNGQERYKIFEYKKPTRVIAAEVDPNNKLALDINPLNNGYKLKSENTATYKYGSFWFYMMQNILHLFTSLI